MAKACSNAKRYRATRYPACNGGNPCRECLRKWHAARERDAIIPR